MEKQLQVLAFLFSLMGVVLHASDSEDPHLDSNGFFDENAEDFSLTLEASSPAPRMDQTPLVIPSKPQKPAVPTLFAVASDLIQDWKSEDVLPPPPALLPAPERSVASVPVPTETEALTAKELKEERAFRDQVMEASIGDSSPTYRKILRVLSEGKVK